MLTHGAAEMARSSARCTELGSFTVAHSLPGPETITLRPRPSHFCGEGRCCFLPGVRGEDDDALEALEAHVRLLAQEMKEGTRSMCMWPEPRILVAPLRTRRRGGLPLHGGRYMNLW